MWPLYLRGSAVAAVGCASILTHPAGIIDLMCAALRAPAGMTEAAEAALAAAPEYLCGTGYAVDSLPELRDALAQRFTERATENSDIVVIAGR